MKNLMIYISPTGSFDNPRPDLASNDAGPLVKVQIDNSLALGWKRKDIMLVTNFEYQYRQVKARVLKDIEFFERKPQATKVNAIIKLFEHGLIKDQELYWFHDLDAFQLEPIEASEIQIDQNEMALTDFGGGKHFRGEDRWSGGIIFFKSGSFDIFPQIKDLMYQKSIDEEEALGLLVIGDKKIMARVKKVNNTYNYIGYNLLASYEKSLKPLKVVHFHPLTGKKRLGGVGVESAYRFFKGENPLNTPLITESLVKLLEHHTAI